MLKFLLCHIHFIQSYYNNGAIFSVYWLGPQTKIFPSSWFCLKEALASVKLSSCDRKASFFTLSQRISLIFSSAFSGTPFLSSGNRLGSKHAKSWYNCSCLRNRIFRFSTMLSIMTLKVFTLYPSSSPETL